MEETTRILSNTGNDPDEVQILIVWQGSIGQDVWRQIPTKELESTIDRLQKKGYSNIRYRPAWDPKAPWTQVQIKGRF